MEAARTRIGRVTLKGNLHLLQPTIDPFRAEMERGLRDMLDQYLIDLAGFAVVVWGADFSSTAHISMREGAQTIPGVMVPDFVRERLMAYRIENWALESVEQRWFSPNQDSPS